MQQNFTIFTHHKSIPALTLLLVFLLSGFIFSQPINYNDSWGNQGYTLLSESSGGIEINFSITSFEIQERSINGTTMSTVHLPSVFLPNDEGAPDLPGTSRFIALPVGSKATFQVIEARTETIENIDIAPAFRIPKGNEDAPLLYAKNDLIYSNNALYPEQPVILSEKTNIRGVDVVQLGITPFQYNPVTRQLIIYRDIKVSVTFTGGNGYFGEDRLRSRWFDPIIQNIVINHNSLPDVQYNNVSYEDDQDFEYLIICPDDQIFVAWADSIRNYRTLQGIRTGVVTTTGTGGNNATQIENYINNAYNTWNIPPVAILFLGDYGTSGSTVHSPTWNNYCVSDHIYADVNGNDMADIVTARITAQNGTQLETMINKFLNYENSPPTNSNYYNHPITAMGWQTERWFQICSESVNGFFEFALGKNPVRENAIYIGTPPFTIWSTNQNTNMVVNYFGPSGRGYIPQTPAHLNDWGGNATRLNNDINSGAFMLQHRDHGSETGWGEPDYGISDLSGLTNQDLVFVFSINCLTGKYNMSGTCFAEAFHRHNYGALGLIAASEVSYSFVNDTYVWGLYDGMWPDFMPDYGNPGPEKILPSFGNVYGKYFLQYSNWPYNTSNKEVTYYLFHHHGDAFTTVYTEMPQLLTVTHDAAMLSGVNSFDVTADEYSLISLTVNGDIIGTAEGTGAPVSISIDPQLPGQNMIVTITKQNYYRYQQVVPIVPPTGPYVIKESYSLNDASGNNNGLLDYGESPLVSLTVKNVGVETATNVTVNLRSNDSFVTITDSTEFFGVIGAGSLKTITDCYAFDCDPLIPDGHSVLFAVIATDGVNIWESSFSVEAHSPIFELGTYTVSDPSGNNNGILDPGETADINVELTNTGSSDAVNVMGDLTSADQYITINSGVQLYGNISAGTSVTKSFGVTADVNAPSGHQALFNVDVTADPNLTAGESFSITVGQIPVLMLCLDENHSSSPSMMSCLDIHNISYEYHTTFPPDLTLYKSIFVCLGIFSANHVLTNSEGQLLADYLNQGGMIYMEGGDTWYYDDQTPVHSMFNIDGISDGTSDLGTVLGQTGTFTDGMSFSYTGENSWIDHLTNISPAQMIFRNQSPDYGCAVAYDAGTYRTIGTSFEFGGLADGTSPSTKDELMEKILEFFSLQIIPVELTSFIAEVDENGILLVWETATETNNSGFEVEKSEDNSTFTKVGHIKGNGTTSEKQEYKFRDTDVNGKGKCYYRLKQIDYDGTAGYSEVLEVDYSIIPVEFSLSQNYPNPFNPATTIKFGIPQTTSVTLKIYDALGSEVETLIDEKLEPGYYKHIWDASRFASGVYFYRIIAGTFVKTKKLMILK